MTKINWCLKQKEGIKLIEPNETIGLKYITEAEDDLTNIKQNSPKWQNIMSYYACYNAFYGLLQKIGIKSEIHECTIELIDLFEELQKHKSFLQKLKKTRINTQYYLKKPEPINETEIKEFVYECKHIFNKITYDEIQNIKQKITKK